MNRAPTGSLDGPPLPIRAGALGGRPPPFVRARFIAPPFSALRRLLGGHILAPVAQPRQLLDVGAGTGIWLREAARRWPSARLVALDKDLSLLLTPFGATDPQGLLDPEEGGSHAPAS